jgi:hypothetical protein
MRIFWQLAPASGIKSFDSPADAAAWADAFLAANPTATIEPIERVGVTS